MGILIVEVCESNPAASLPLEVLEDEFAGISVIRSSCLSECELCAQQPYVMVNGDIIAAGSLDSLMGQIRSKIEAELAEWA
ncbi:DUF1450 domain-containing protein [Effusibacillus lacus]|uniref:DUF1450 domain-containing protein n=1 Tax=Effusibacillus lacus TaxID=1348429 RepID=A0A292YTK7_9BACL|nr:DUF1450 domain-containing protein [Effusibacillus lacus]TCS76268.1 uncharacterized protein YuzB (UPF0349 family) [Effusibacillus lacus]GAX91815.1 hypothetical protein EFBL_3506 [Effusibacillus lacus]